MPDLSGTAPPAAATSSPYTVDGYGYDDITLGFDLKGSALSLRRVREMPGREFGTTKRLGYDGAWGKFESLLGRSYVQFKSDSNRLYVQWKPADEGELLRPAGFEGRYRDLERRLGVVGIETWERVWVTRLDVSVDLLCNPEDGKALLDGLEAARLPRGQRITVDGQPRSTVYFRPRASNDIVARAYCRKSEDEERTSVREDSTRSRPAVQAEGMVGGLLLQGQRGGSDDLGKLATATNKWMAA